MDPSSSPDFIGFNTILGFRIVEWREDLVRIACDIDARHMNRTGILHGGVLSTLIDAALGHCGIYSADPKRRRRSVTLSMAVSFLGQTDHGTITCTARRRGGGRTVYMADAEVHGPDGALLATGQGVYRYIADEIVT